ncbi:MAG: glucose-6-phosphate isomerase [Cytophagales bacterium]|nr:glucose-6-phosphate isomerase [Bernardetiaceae bacterium]MDW8210041.1 glucose-6-phosphate isomerase [Cytophagales bacterium]
MESLKIDISQVLEFLLYEDIARYQEEIDAHYKALHNRTGKGNQFLGWMNLPSQTSPDLLREIETTASRLREMAEIFVVVGIGGSYMGAKAVIEALSHHFSSMLSKERRQGPLILFAGQNICADYHADLMDILQDKSYAVAVISKSGTTTEPAIAFRLLKQHLEQRYGKAQARQRIVAITDPSSGALRKMAQQEGYQTFDIPPDVGGRFSVLTPVGLLPIAVAGFDIGRLMAGAKEMEELSYRSTQIQDNPISMYAAVRNALYKRGKCIEILVTYHPRLQYLVEWWKQLFGESEGKDFKAIFPVGVSFTTDLHSLGQLIQEGERNLFETVISVAHTRSALPVPLDEEDLDKLNYLAGKDMQTVNKMAEKGTLLAHVAGGVPNLVIQIPTINEYSLGQLFYFFEKACAISGYILGVNPFDQPGVEAYKNNMFALLGKPGYEKLAAQLQARLQA